MSSAPDPLHNVKFCCKQELLRCPEMRPGVCCGGREEKAYALKPLCVFLRCVFSL